MKAAAPTAPPPPAGSRLKLVDDLLASMSLTQHIAPIRWRFLIALSQHSQGLTYAQLEESLSRSPGKTLVDLCADKLVQFRAINRKDIGSGRRDIRIYTLTESGLQLVRQLLHPNPRRPIGVDEKEGA